MAANQPMDIGVLADTHIYSWPPALLKLVNQHLAGVELIVHAGDIVNPLILDSLNAPVIAVCGNSDSPMVAATLPARRVIELNGFSIGLTHGYGPPEGLRERVRAQFADVQAVVFGHSHVPFMGCVDGAFLFNPGSLTRAREGRPSLGILHLHDKIEGTVIRL